MGARILQSMTGLPGPMQGLVYVATGGSLLTTVIYMADPSKMIWKIVLGVLLAVGLVLILFQLVLTIRDKSKGGKMASVLSRSSSAGGKSDPGETARRDDLRKRFEEGVETFRKAGKDLYSLPWVLLVGPSGSGKTEALRHCGVGFPPGLQDHLQGSGGTLNMHWWFTNQAVVLDTAGRMFMQDADTGGGNEWKDFLKLLKAARSHCPINGLLLVISSETLLKDSSEKIEKDAGAIARQLDVIQRTLDVRFPVFVIVTKCDKIIGFREFFDGLTDPNLQHQMLGWSNPAPLDEAFKPDQVEKHLDQVRQRLMRRRGGLLQNPVHTTDPTARRTDQVDELFELPDNMMRIAPRLKRYLELIFVAGEWSPKPLFLRGIYFTSSMREGQALDMALASTLGVDVESLPGTRQWEKDKAFFLRDVFLSKVFKEKGLVTSATNVGKQLAKQRAAMLFGLIGVLGVFAVLMVLGFFTFNDRIGPATGFWRSVQAGFNSTSNNEGVQIISLGTAQDPQPKYLGRERFETSEAFVGRSGDALKRRVELLEETTGQADPEEGAIRVPAVAKPLGPFLGFSDNFVSQQADAHRAVFERTTLIPLVQAVRSKIGADMLASKPWTSEAIAALAEIVRLQTYALGEKPAEEINNNPGTGTARPVRPAVNIDAMMRYVLDDAEYAKFAADADELAKASVRAYEEGFDKDRLAKILQPGNVEDPRSWWINQAVTEVLGQITSPSGAPGSTWAQLTTLSDQLEKFRTAERAILDLNYIKEGTGDPTTPDQFAQTASGFSEQFAKMDDARTQASRIINDQIGREKVENLPKLVDDEAKRLREQATASVMHLRNQLPAIDGGLLGKVAGAAKDAAGDKAKDAPLSADQLAAAAGKLPGPVKDLVASVDAAKAQVQGDEGPLAVAISSLRNRVGQIAPLLVAFNKDAQSRRAYELHFEAYAQAKSAIEKAGEPATAGAGRIPVFSELTRDADAERNRIINEISARLVWQPSNEQLNRLSTDAQKEAVKADVRTAVTRAQRAVDIAQAMRLRQAASTFFKAADQADALRTLARDLAAQRREAMDDEDPALRLDPVRLTEIPMSDSQGECEAAFHPAIADTLFKDWKRLSGLISPESGASSERMLVDPALQRAFATTSRSYEQYAKEYVNYWHEVAMVRSMPRAETWDAFAAGVSRLDIASVLDGLETQKRKVLDAMDKVPARDFENVTSLGAKRKEVEDSMAKTTGTNLVADYKRVLGNWKDLISANLAPDAAAERIVNAYRNGQAKVQYFDLYATDGPRLDYWNELLFRGVKTLKEAAASGQQRAWNDLVNQSKGVPLYFGATQEIPFSQLGRMRQVAEAAAQADGPSAGPAAADMPGRIQNELLGLTGADRATAANREWLRNVSKILGYLAGEKAATDIYFDVRNDAAAGSTGDARSNYSYAALSMNGQVQVRAFQIDTSNPNVPEDLKGKLRIPFPAPANTQILLWKRDPGFDFSKPDDAISLPGDYGAFGAVVRGGEMSKEIPGEGAWSAPAISRQGFVLWLKVVSASDKPLPKKSDWPTPGTGPWQ
jgi:hypothetical protein